MRDNSGMPPPCATTADEPGATLRLGEILRLGADRLRPVSESPRLDCELLLAHALGMPRAALYARSAEIMASEPLGRIRVLLEERAGGRPLAQIIGRKEFFSLEFEITPQVLTPRPETELLVEVASDHLEAAGRDAACLDLGAGCGAVAVALARLLPGISLVATDISDAALDVARRNAARLAPGRIRFMQGSWYAAVRPERRFDAIAANPPYVESRLCRRKPLCFEPRLALDGGTDGLRHLRTVISGAPRHLKPGGLLAVEHGADQGEAVHEMMARAGLRKPASHRDLAERQRISAARMPL